MTTPTRLAVLTLAFCVGCADTEDAKTIRDIEKCGVHAFTGSGRFAGQIYVEIRGGQGDTELQRIAPLLRNFTRINGLHMHDSNITDLGLASVKGLHNVGSINLDHTKITDSGLDSLTGMTALHHITLTGTRVTDAGVAKLKRALPEIIVEKLNPVQDQALQTIYKAGGTVQSGADGRITAVTFESFFRLTDARLRELQNSLEALKESLEEIDLAGPGITDEGLKCVKGLSHLKRLKVTGTAVTEAGIRSLRKDLPQLEISR